MLLRVAGPALYFGLAVAQAAPAVGQTTADDMARGKMLIATGQTRDATALLERHLVTAPDNVEILFLLGMAALGESNNRLAIARFRAALVVAPNAARIRLELARAFYLAKDYENAFRQFQFALADNPPKGVVATIERYLTAIRLQKNWSYNFGFGLAPDTNINNGTSAREAEIFGLPFEIGDQTRKKSGIGLTIEGGIEVAPRVSESVRMRVGGAAMRNEYRGHRFDDMTVALHAGPRIVEGKWDVSVLGMAFRRWYGGSRLNHGIGARGEATWYSNPRTAVSFGISGQRLRYHDLPLQSGQFLAGWAGVIRAISPSSSITARGSLGRQTAKAGEFSNWAANFGVGYYRDFVGGFSIYAEPSVGFARYDREDSFFEKRRQDWHGEMRLSLLNRRVFLSRFTPRVTYTHARRMSSIDLYDFTQNRLEMSLTTSF